MTQVLTKLKTLQFSYASDAALVTGPPEKRKEHAKEKGQESNKLMTQVLTKLKTNQFSYASDAALVTGPPDERKKRKAPEKAEKASKKRKRPKKGNNETGSDGDFVEGGDSSSSSSLD